MLFKQMRSKILWTSNVTKSFGGVRALKGVSIGVDEGSITMIIGPNGSGKTTLINVISGIYKPDDGKVFFNGREITGLKPHEIFKLGLVRTFQIPQPFTKLTVLENLLVAYPDNPGEKFFGALRRGRWMKVEEEAVEKAFKILIMMDEPAAGVNPVLAHEIFRRFRELRDKLGVTFFLVEHRLEIALRYTDYVYAMANGLVVAEGVPETVMVNPQVVEAYLGG